MELAQLALSWVSDKKDTESSQSSCSCLRQLTPSVKLVRFRPWKILISTGTPRLTSRSSWQCVVNEMMRDERWATAGKPRLQVNVILHFLPTSPWVTAIWRITSQNVETEEAWKKEVEVKTSRQVTGAVCKRYSTEIKLADFAFDCLKFYRFYDVNCADDSGAVLEHHFQHLKGAAWPVSPLPQRAGDAVRQFLMWAISVWALRKNRHCLIDSRLSPPFDRIYGVVRKSNIFWLCKYAQGSKILPPYDNTICNTIQWYHTVVLTLSICAMLN